MKMINDNFQNRKNTLTGTSLVGGSVNYERVKDDFYATDPQSVRDLFDIADIKGEHFHEPCVGQGHIAEVIKEYFPKAKVLVSDLVDRGYPNTLIRDYTQDFNMSTNWVITNPPYKYARKFIEQALKQADTGVAMFLKIQFLEGQSRIEFFKNTPLKYVYVFSKRQDPWRDGNSLNPKTGKKWGSTMCFAWFVWEHGYDGKPMIEWI